MPPFGGQWLEAVTEHCLTEHHAIVELYGCEAVTGRIIRTLGIATEVRMALWTKPIERATHVEFLLRLHVEERQIKCRANAAMAGVSFSFNVNPTHGV